MEATVSFPAHEHYVLSLAFTADSQTLVSGGMDGLIKQWAVGEWSELATFRGHTGVVHSVAISPDGGLLASGSGDATVRVWSLSTNRLLRIFGCRKKAVRSVAFSADNGWVAAACHGGRAKVWNVHGKLVAQLAAGKHNLTSIALSPDCRLAFLAGEGGEISVWSLPAGHRVLVYPMTGACTIDGTRVDEGILAVVEGDTLAVTGAAERSEVIVLTGQPIGEPVARYGPFVMNTEAEIRQAFADFESGRFGAPTD